MFEFSAFVRPGLAFHPRVVVKDTLRSFVAQKAEEDRSWEGKREIPHFPDSVRNDVVVWE